MAADVSWDQLRDLAGFRARKGCAISIFLNLDPAFAATAPEVATKINSLIDEAEKHQAASREGLSHQERKGLKADFERIRRFFDTDFNRDGARDHFPYCFSYLLAGGGVPGGAVIGASDRTGSRPAHRPVSPPEFAATLYRLLGLDTADARMRPFVRDALPVAELL